MSKAENGQGIGNRWGRTDAMSGVAYLNAMAWLGQTPTSPEMREYLAKVQQNRQNALAEAAQRPNKIEDIDQNA